MHGCTAHTDLIGNIAPGLPDARLFRIKLQVLSSRGTFPTRPAPSGSVFHMENTRSTTEWLSIRGSSCPDITVFGGALVSSPDAVRSGSAGGNRESYSRNAEGWFRFSIRPCVSSLVTRYPITGGANSVAKTCIGS